MSDRLTQEEAEERISEGFKDNVILISIYKSRRDLVKLKCLDCGYEWEPFFKNVGYGTTHRCPYCIKNSGKHTQCSFCGKELYRLKSDVESNKSGHFYCSTACGNRHKNMLREKDGEWVTSNNYRRRAFAKYPHKCNVCGYDEDERMLEIHHIYGRDKNAVEDLMILCPMCHRKITLGYYKLIGNQLIPVVE